MQLAAVALLIAASATAGTAPVCTTDTGCSLNGKCAAGRCVCDASWGGSACSTLSLRPVSKEAGFHSPFGTPPDETSSWGGAVARLADGSWGMVASEMVHVLVLA